MEITPQSFYVFRNPETGIEQVGKVTTVEGDIVSYLVYAKVQTVFKTPKAYHTKYELVRTDELAKEFKLNTLQKIEVLRMEQFRVQFRNKKPEPGHYFFRQRL